MAKVKWLRDKPSLDSDLGCLGSQFPHLSAGETPNTAGITERRPERVPGAPALHTLWEEGLVICYFVSPCDGGDTISPDSVSVLQMVI